MFPKPDVEDVIMTPDVIAEITAQVVKNIGTVAENEEAEKKKAADLVEAEEQKIEKTITAVLRGLNLPGQSPAFNRLKSLGYPIEDGPMDAMNQWYLTGQKNDDIKEYEKAAWQEGTDSEGGYTTVEGQNKIIWAFRDEMSFITKMGCIALKVDESVFNIPLENTRLTDWVITAEEAAYDQDEGDLGQLAMTLYNLTKLHKISVQLLRFTKVDLVGFITRRFARSWYLTENKYALIGTGSGQPQGMFVGGTAFATLAGAAAITAAEVMANYYGLAQQYRTGAGRMAGFVKGSTNAAIRALTGDPHKFAETPLGKILNMEDEQLMGKLLIEDSNIDALSTDNKVLGFGNPREALAVVEVDGMIIIRDDSLYRANGQVGFFANKWFSCGVANAEAFQYSTTA